MQRDYDTCESHHERGGAEWAEPVREPCKTSTPPVDECAQSSALEDKRENYEYGYCACFADQGHCT
jgi:hypothetical protein